MTWLQRLLTDVQLAGLVLTVCWAVWYFAPVFLDALLDPHSDRFDDIDELVEAERRAER